MLVHSAALPLPAICKYVVAVLAVDKNGAAAVVYAAGMFTGPELLIIDYRTEPLSGNLLVTINAEIRELAVSCRSQGYVVMVPGTMFRHAQVLGLPVEAIPDHIKAEDLLLNAASFVSAGSVKLCHPAHERTRTTPFGSALSFHAGADVDDPLRSAAILAITLSLDATLSTTRAA
jgi:hypothetical protein